jgi:hypothetical protein
MRQQQFCELVKLPFKNIALRADISEAGIFILTGNSNGH